MSKFKNVKAECDVCGFAYPRSQMKKTEYGIWVCTRDWDGSYNRMNHPQRKNPDLRDHSQYVMNARPDPNIDRNINWEDATEVHTTIYQWDILDKNWNSV